MPAFNTGEGRALVLLHGWGASRKQFQNQVDAFSDKYRVITFDFRGHGDLKNIDAPLTVERLSEDLCAVFDHFELRDVICIGWSMGAMIAWGAMRANPDLQRHMAGFVSIEMTPRIPNENGWLFGLKGARGEAETKAASELIRQNWSAAVERFVPRVFSKDVDDALAPVVQGMIDDAKHLNPQTLTTLWRSMAAQDLRGVLDEIFVPTLVVYGKRSQLYASDMSKFVSHACRGDIVAFDSSGHAPHVEQPIEFNHAIQDFIDRVATNAVNVVSSDAVAC